MPGTRLTHTDRLRIADGLRSGLGYAEIARGLGRPGSTVSREVARNGGPRRYQPRHAQQATAWRARRRPLPPVGTGPGPVTGEAFEDRFVAMMAATGVPTMMARVLIRLFTSESGSATTPELVAVLGVSPASISAAVHWLERRGLIRREREGRRHRYLVDGDVWYQAWQASLASMAMWAELSHQGAEIYGTSTPVGDRMRTASLFFHHIGLDMAAAAEHWRDQAGRSSTSR